MRLELIDQVFMSSVAQQDQARLHEILSDLRDFYHAHQGEIDARVDALQADADAFGGMSR